MRRRFSQPSGEQKRLRDSLTSEQQEFITQAVKALVDQDGMIVPVRLALFFETFKSREWTTKTLEEIGDAEGVGVAFLERTFNSDYADPILRSHQEAAQPVLGALLPESGSEIKRPRRPWRELLDASGYASRPKLFLSRPQFRRFGDQAALRIGSGNLCSGMHDPDAKRRVRHCVSRLPARPRPVRLEATNSFPGFYSARNRPVVVFLHPCARNP